MGEKNQQMLDVAAAQAQASQAQVLGVVQIALIAVPGGAMQISVNSSLQDSLQALGLIEMGKAQLMAQAQQPAPTKLVRASGSIPRA